MKLPCDVKLPPATIIGTGCPLTTLLTAMDQRTKPGWPEKSRTFSRGTPDTASVTLGREAAMLLQEIALHHHLTPREYIEALLHYAGSIYHRPGSGEANKAFDINDYLAPEDPDNPTRGFADRWFND
jgi:hypothetical protein